MKEWYAELRFARAKRTLVRQAEWTKKRRALNREMRVAGYQFVGSATCPACQATILWYRTPKQKIIPLNEASFEPHWKRCPDGPHVIFDPGGTD